MRPIPALFGLLVVAAAGTGVARDPTTPPALGDTPDGGERSPGTNPARAPDRLDSETRTKDDEMLATAVEKSLADDPRVNAMRVKVDARAGVVQLTGDATSQEESDAAAHVAQQVSGVRRVDNKLTVSR